MDISNQINSILDGTERKEGYKLQGIVYQQKRIIKKENAKKRAEEEDRKREWAKYGASTLEEYLKAKQKLCGAKMQEDSEEQTKKQEGNPQLEDGFVKIANELVDVFCSHRLSGEEWQIIWSVFNKTYRWHRKEDWISLSQFVELTNIKKPNVIRAIKKLLNKKIIIKNDNKYMFNKHYKEWSGTSKKNVIINTDKEIINTDKDKLETQSQSIKTDEIINTDNIIKKDNNIIKNDNLALSKMIPTKETITKETITKDNKKEIHKERKLLNEKAKLEIPSWLDKEVWNDFIEHRKALKKPMTIQAIKLAFKKLEELKNQGYNPVDVINQSILNGWQGLFELKSESRRRANKLPTQEDFEQQARKDPECYYAQWGIQLWEVKKALWKSIKKYPEEEKEIILQKSERRVGKEWWKE